MFPYLRERERDWDLPHSLVSVLQERPLRKAPPRSGERERERVPHEPPPWESYELLRERPRRGAGPRRSNS